MFKLESYVTPWLLGYLNQYVKLRPEDLELSLWGGDAILYNLDLRLDVLQKAAHLPIVFKSGHIHELRLHVPWTKLGSEAMVITINTVECIVKVRDTAYSDDSSSASSNTSSKASMSAKASRRKLKRQATEDLPPGYLQSILNRVVNNVTFIVNNLIIKFVEDDIVLSVNIKSAECYSCDSSWNRAFVDLVPEDLTLRKIINFSDLTVCLDKSNSDGKIEIYQEPLLYRCFITCRLHMAYESIGAKLPNQIKVNAMCDKMECLMSDTQLPIFLRLLELCVALYYGYLDVQQQSPEIDHGTNDMTGKRNTSAVQGDEEDVDNEEEDEQEEGWAAWMWSMVPQILPEDEQEGRDGRLVDEPPVLSLGFYVHQASLTFKVTGKGKEKKFGARGQKLAFHPFLKLEAEGLGVEVLMQGVAFFTIQCGIHHISLATLGPCICEHPADAASEQDILKSCAPQNEEDYIAFNCGSLFDPMCDQNQGVKAKFILDRDEHLNCYNEQYSQRRFGAFWMDYLSTLVLPDSPHSGSQSSESDAGEGAFFHQEASTCRFVLGPSQLKVTSSSVHRIHKMLCYAWNHHYEPYQKKRMGSAEGSSRVQLTDMQLAGLEEGVPTCSYHLILLQPAIIVTPANHPPCNISAKAYTTRCQRSRDKSPLADCDGSMLEMKVCAERCDLQLLSPMYPARLVRLVSGIAGPSSNLLYHCHSHTQIKVFSLQACLQRPARRDATCPPVIVVPPVSAAFYFRDLLLPHLWTNSHLPAWERSYEVLHLSVTLSKAGLLAGMQLVSSWIQPASITSAYYQSLTSDLLPEHSENAVVQSTLELSLSGLEIKCCYTPLVYACTGNLSSLQLLLYTPGGGQGQRVTVPLVYGPVDSSSVTDRVHFQQQQVSCVMKETDCITFTVQKPHHTSITEAPAVLLVRMESIAACADPALLQWFSYRPRAYARPTTSMDTPTNVINVPLAQASCPLQPGGSHISVRSNSSPSRPSTSRLFSPSASHARSPANGSASHSDTESPKRQRATDGITDFFISAFPLLRMMHVQVEVKSGCLFIPKTSVGRSEAVVDVPANVQLAWQQGWVEEVVVVCMPTLNIHSMASSSMDIMLDIPITVLHGSLLSEKLPWTVEFGELSMFTLHAKGSCQPLVSGLSVTSTVGATAQYSPPTSDTIQSLALCLHLDFQSPVLSLSDSQVNLLWKSLAVLMEVVNSSWRLTAWCLSEMFPCSHSPDKAGVEDKGASSGTTQHKQEESSWRQQATSATDGMADLGEAVTTDVSDELSHHTSPLHTIVSSEPASSAIKLSLWLQCILPRFTMRLFTTQNSGEVSVVMEDMTLSCDMQKVYCKVKMAVGNLGIHNFVHRENGEREAAAGCPVLLSTSQELAEHLSMSAHTRFAQGQSSPAHDSADKACSFFSLTFTRAVCKNVHSKLNKMNVDLLTLAESEEDQPSHHRHNLFFYEFVNEVCLKIKPVDFVLHLPTVEWLLSMWTSGDSVHHAHSHPLIDLETENRNVRSMRTSWAGLFPDLPLLYVDMGAVRLFLPVPMEACPAQKQGKRIKSTVLHDFVLLQWAALQVQPHADNPLPRYPVERELFMQALQAGVTQRMGSCVEDRQFQLTLHSLSFASGMWTELLTCQRQSNQDAHLISSVQIPALDWNNDRCQRSSVAEVELTPMVMPFDLCLVVAPPIVYKGLNLDQKILVCGITAELNVVSDLDLQLSAQQLKLLTNWALHVLLLVSSFSRQNAFRHASPTSKATLHDSGVVSEVSACIQPAPEPTAQRDVKHLHVPSNILLTAGRISLTLYSHLQSCLNEDHSFSTDIDCVQSFTTSKSRGENKVCEALPSARASDDFISPSQIKSNQGIGNCEPQPNMTACEEDSFMPSLENAAMTGGKKSGAGEEGVDNCQCDERTVSIKPLVYLYMAQPHVVFHTLPSTDKLELSCYDILIKGVKQDFVLPVTGGKLTPDHADFSMYLLETRAGQPDVKTGIPPSLLTVQICGLLSAPASLDVKLERPVRIRLSDNLLPQLSDFMRYASCEPAVGDGNQWLLGQTADSQLSKRPAAAGGARQRASSHWMLDMVDTASHVSMQTQQVFVSLERLDMSDVKSAILTSTEVITVSLKRQEKMGGISKVNCSVCLQDISVETVHRESQHALAGPVTVEADALVCLPERGAVTPPQLVVDVQLGLLLVYVSQEHLLCLQHLLSPGAAVEANAKSPAAKIEKQEKKTIQPTVVNPSHDDLRSGQFVYLQNEDGRVEWPDPGQVVFSADSNDAEVDSMLTWAYSHPRLITTLSTLPVPFHLPTVHTPHSLTVSCKLQYWDECIQDFVTYTSFELSEDKSSAVSLPQVDSCDVDGLAVSCIWRVVICQPPQVLNPQHLSSSSAGTARNCAQVAGQLAGSMRVDSALVPALVPALQLACTLPSLRIHFLNNLASTHPDVGGSLAGYRQSWASREHQQWALITMERLSLISSHLPLLRRSLIKVSCVGAFDVVDYSSLTLQPVVERVQLCTSMTLHHHNQPSSVEVSVSSSEVRVNLGRSVMHTINTSLAALSQAGEAGEKRSLLLAHIIVCNNTQQPIRFGQAGTDENISLTSQSMSQYSWRSLTTKKQLHLCVDDHAGALRWCAPVDVSSDGDVVRVVRTRDQRYTLIIQVSSLSSLHKQVTVSGQFLVCSHLSQAMEVRFQMREARTGECEHTAVVECGRRRPSLVVEHEDMGSVSVRLAGHSLPWSHALPLAGKAMHSNQLIKILLPDGKNSIHVWCRIFCQHFSETRQKLIFLSPLYIVRSHLPLPLHASLLTPRTKQCQVLEIEGQGHEYQLQCMGGDITQHLSFRLGPELAESSPPVVLSSGLIDQMEHTVEASMDLQSLCRQQHRPLAPEWPYSTHHPPSMCQERWSEVQQAGVDLNVQLSQYLPGCSTLLIDIAPSCLVTNATPLHLCLCASDQHWTLPKGCTIAPPNIQELQLGCEKAGVVWRTATVPVSGDEVDQHRYSPHLDTVLFLDGQVQLHFMLPSEVAAALPQVVPLAVVSEVKHGIRVITITERFRLINMSGLPLEARLLAAPQQGTQLELDHFKLNSITLPAGERQQERAREATEALLSWQLLHDEITNVQPLELILYISFGLFTHGASCERPAEWSVPVRMVSSKEGWRSTVCVDGGEVCQALCVTCTVDRMMTYVAITEDRAPMWRIINCCPFQLQYGQALLPGTSIKDVVVQEETEVVSGLPAVASGGCSFYTMPHVNMQFPHIDSRPPPRLHVRMVLPPQAHSQQDGSELHHRYSDWSAGIAVDAGDTFLSIKNTSIKVNIQLQSMTHEITFSLLTKAEVSAKEVRSRIQDSQQVKRMEVKESPSTCALADVSVEEGCSESMANVLVRERSVSGTPWRWRGLSLGVVVERMELTLVDDVCGGDVLRRLLQVEVGQVVLACYPVGRTAASVCVALSVHHAHVHNPLAHHGLYDFPTVLQPQQLAQPIPLPLQGHWNLPEVNAMLRANSFFHVEFVTSRDDLTSNSWFFDSVKISVKPLRVFFEDSYFYLLYEECGYLVPDSVDNDDRSDSRKNYDCIPQKILSAAYLNQQPLRVQYFCIQPISLLLSVHASVHLFLATDHAPLTLGQFEHNNLFTGFQQLVHNMGVHYVTAAIFRAGMVVGSMDLLGSPTGLVRSVGAGLSDLLVLPYQGLTRSPAAFVTGVFAGVSSLMRNVTAGMMTSVTNFASSVSRNMDRLSLDSNHQQQQEENRRYRPEGLSSGLYQGLTGFGISLLGAVAGLVEQPMQSVITRRGASPGRTAGSLVSGVGKGLVGIITKPIGGAAEFVSQTGQGLLKGSGLKQDTGPRPTTDQIQRLHLPTSWFKYQMKVVWDSVLLVAVEGCEEDDGVDGSVVLLLTQDAVVVLGQKEDAQRQTLPLSMLQCTAPAPAILALSLADTAQIHQSSDDRVADFINSTADLSVTGATCYGWNSDNSAPSNLINKAAAKPAGVHQTSVKCWASVRDEARDVEACSSFHYRVDPYWCQLFMALFHKAKNHQIHRGFTK